MRVVFVNNSDESSKIQELFDIDRYVQLDARKQGDDIVFSVLIRTDKDFDDVFILKALKENPYIISIDRIDDEN